MTTSYSIFIIKLQAGGLGSVIVLAALLMTFMFAVMALSVDLGYLCLSRSELQATADSAALAGAAALYPMPDGLDVNMLPTAPQIDDAISEATSFAG